MSPVANLLWITRTGITNVLECLNAPTDPDGITCVLTGYKVKGYNNAQFHTNLLLSLFTRKCRFLTRRPSQPYATGRKHPRIPAASYQNRPLHQTVGSISGEGRLGCCARPQLPAAHGSWVCNFSMPSLIYIPELRGNKRGQEASRPQRTLMLFMTH